jgi:DNA-binding ferritin-like protein (Dps family)
MKEAADHVHLEAHLKGDRRQAAVAGVQGARATASPNYRTAVEAIERYLMHFGPMEADSAASVFEDVADLFERAAADGTPSREIVGKDPEEFVDALVRNYSKGGYVDRERDRLTQTIESAEREQEKR